MADRSSSLIHDSGNRIRILPAPPTGAGAIEIEVVSDTPFPVRNELVVLRVGEIPVSLSRYPHADLRTLVFTATVEEFQSFSEGDEVWVQYGLEPSPERWPFGRLCKSDVR